MGTSVTAATFDDALRGCIDEEFPGKAPIQAFPLDMEAAATTQGPPECEYRVPVGHRGATEGEEDLIAILEATKQNGAWMFTFKRVEDDEEN